MTYNIYMGWDKREQLAFAVARHSILEHCPEAGVIPLDIRHLTKILQRPIETLAGGQLYDPISEAPMSTEFAISRFCVPFIQKSGWALFVDCDILCLADIRELFSLADPQYALQVVKHETQGTTINDGNVIHGVGSNGFLIHSECYLCREATLKSPTIKMDGQKQTFYPRKNWSSVMLWNCAHPSHKQLTFEALNTWPGRDLHAFKWLADNEIGDLPLEWNYLVNVSPPLDHLPKLAHFTLGTPDMVPSTHSLAPLWNSTKLALT